MAEMVMIRGRYVSTNRPMVLFVFALLMAIVSAVNFGVGISRNCAGYNYWCSRAKTSYIIAGSCFAVSAVCFLISAIALRKSIKTAQRNQQQVVVQGNVVVAGSHPQQTAAVYPGFGQQASPYTPNPAMSQQAPPYSPNPMTQQAYPHSTNPATHEGLPYSTNPPAVGFAVGQQPAQPIPSKSEDPNYQHPPPYVP